MPVISESERATYDLAWSIDGYAEHSPGVTYLPIFERMVGQMGFAGQSVLDAGCGTGQSGLALHALGARVTLCDITAEGLIPDAAALPFVQTSLWEDLRPKVGFHTYVYCCDVLEHIPAAFTMLAVQRMLDVSRDGVLLSISLVTDRFGALVGTTLHHTVQSFVWWRNALAEVGEVVEARDLLIAGLFMVAPRKR